jgi:hypothetical protein
MWKRTITSANSLACADVIETLLSSQKQIVVPRCVVGHNGRAYDLNSWRAGNTTLGANATLAEVIKYHDSIHDAMVAAGKPNELLVEGYGKSVNMYMHEMRDEGEVVRLDAVGGAMLLVDAELHRKGLIFPPFVYRHRIETEGLSMMALDMGVMVRSHQTCFCIVDVHISQCGYAVLWHARSGNHP